MDLCTIIQFKNALRQPDIFLRRYAALRFEPDTLSVTKYFAECRADYYGKPVMVYAPITQFSMKMATRAVGVLPKHSDRIGKLRIFPEEMLCTGMKTSRCSLIVEALPMGTLLSEALHTHLRSNLIAGMEGLKEHLREQGVSVNHLHPDSIIVDSKYRWHVIRPYYTTEDIGNDDETFNKLLELIDRYAIRDIDNIDSLVCDSFAPYGCSIDSYGRTLHPVSEGLRRFSSAEGTGFEDEAGNIVIEASFRDATDFLEDRSIITTHTSKMGIIDRKGRYIIEPLYDNIDFDVDDGISTVIDGNRCAKFDYFGTQLTEWTTNCD